MFVQYAVRNNFGQTEDYLVSYLDQIMTTGKPAYRRARIGNAIVESRSGETVLEFREFEARVWRVHGTYSDTQFTYGSVIWSKVMKRFCSCKEASAPITEWKRQDSNSMDLVGKNVEIAIPSAVKIALSAKINSRISKTGPLSGTAAPLAISLHRLAPATMRKVSPTAASFSLTDTVYNFDGTLSCAPGNIVILEDGRTTRVVSPTQVSDIQGYYWAPFTGTERVRRTFVQTTGGQIIEVSTTD